MERIIKILKEEMIIDTLREMLDNSNLVRLKINLNDSQKLEFIQTAILQEVTENKELLAAIGDYAIEILAKKVLSIINENDK